MSIVVFAATQALPSDPARAILGRDATPELLTVVREQLGLDRPLIDQYRDWLGGVLSGDFGSSLATRSPVADLITNRLVNSITLVFLCAAVAIPLSVVLGVLAAARRDRLFDRSTLLVSLGLTAVPEFILGAVLIIFFATTVFSFLPAVALIPPGDTPFTHPREIALPALALVLSVVPYLYRLVRGSMIDVLDSEYVAMARLKGVPERRIIWRHALPNALIPVIQGSALVFVWLLGGIVVVEFLFRFPGLGSLLTDAIANRDLPVVQAVILIFAVGVVFFNLLADLLTIYVTPKLRVAARNS